MHLRRDPPKMEGNPQHAVVYPRDFHHESRLRRPDEVFAHVWPQLMHVPNRVLFQTTTPKRRISRGKRARGPLTSISFVFDHLYPLPCRSQLYLVVVSPLDFHVPIFSRLWSHILTKSSPHPAQFFLTRLPNNALLAWIKIWTIHPVLPVNKMSL
jgi:hypothetical protein